LEQYFKYIYIVQATSMRLKG